MHLEEVGKTELIIKEIKDKGSKVILIFTNDEKLKIYKTTYLKFNLASGEVITPELGKEIVKFETQEEIVKYLKGLIAKRPYTEKVLLKKALAKFRDYHLVKDAINDLKSFKLIDDKDYIENYLDYFDKNNFGQYFIINFFRSNGLSEKMINELNFDEENEKRKAKNYFDSVKNKVVSNNFAKQKKKIYERMLLRGFNIEIILDVLNDLKIDIKAEHEKLERDYRKVKNKYFMTNDVKLDANAKIVNKLIDKGYNLDDINEIIEKDADFEKEEGVKLDD